MEYVLANAQQGNAASICDAIEDFAHKELVPQGSWLKIAGGLKSSLLVEQIRKLPKLAQFWKLVHMLATPRFDLLQLFLTPRSSRLR